MKTQNRWRNVPIGTPLASAGFSLIELLVALLVVVLLTSIVSLNVGSGGQDIELEAEVRQLADAIEYAQAEAEFTGADHGLLIEFSGRADGGRYRGVWLRLYDQGWAAPRGTGTALQDIAFAADIDLMLALEGQPDVDLMSTSDMENPSPQVVVFAGGEMTPGALEWLDARTGDLLWRLEWDLFGRTGLLRRGEAAGES